jgi:hypothetical protein
MGLLVWFVRSPLAEQAMTFTTAGGMLRVIAPAVDVIEGVVLDRLRDGRSVRLDFELAVLAQPTGPPVAQTRQSFNISFDLWEERFAVTLVATPARSVSHLTRKAGEAWCFENLTIPLTALSRFGGSAPFWLRLSYQVPDAKTATDDETFTLEKLIDVFGRKRRDSQLGKSVEAGPFRLSK